MSEKRAHEKQRDAVENSPSQFREKKVSEQVLKNAKSAYKKRLLTNYILIPVFFFYLFSLCSHEASPRVRLLIFPLSMLVLGSCLFAHHCNRIRKDEHPTYESYSLATDLMNLTGYVALTYTAATSACIILLPAFK